MAESAKSCNPRSATELAVYELPGNRFPCRQNIIGAKESKNPLAGCRWRTAQFSVAALERYLQRGHATACAIARYYGVLDVDVATTERPGKRGASSPSFAKY